MTDFTTGFFFAISFAASISGVTTLGLTLDCFLTTYNLGSSALVSKYASTFDTTALPTVL
jgi:hypothetical protein